MDVAAVIAIGVIGGMLAGLFGVGGGAVYVPALVFFLDVAQVRAEATSLLAMIPVAIVGAWRQHGYGNVRWDDAAWVGALSLIGGLAGVLVANAVSERTLEIGFGVLVIWIGAQLLRKALAPTAGKE
jgi:uncharacterized membrane protein YfcA